jgi:hypothetical protein
MAKKKKLYLVWQCSGSYDTYYNRLCGIFDDEEKAQELKAKLDLNIIDPEDCWTVMPQDVFCNWPTEEPDEYGSGDFDYVSEYEGYTSEQRQLQEDRWYLMSEEYGEATIETVNMNEEL